MMMGNVFQHNYVQITFLHWLTQTGTLYNTTQNKLTSCEFFSLLPCLTPSSDLYNTFNILGTKCIFFFSRRKTYTCDRCTRMRLFNEYPEHTIIKKKQILSTRVAHWHIRCFPLCLQASNRNVFGLSETIVQRNATRNDILKNTNSCYGNMKNNL